MGRLDDASKRKVVELREAGLSFRKIKAVLELENIKVSAQAIYLFLKEFQGRAQKEDGTAGKSSHGAPASMPTREVMISESRQVGWSDQQLRNLLREASRVVGYPSSTNSSPQAGSSSEGRGGLNSGTGSAGRREAQEGEKDEDIRIVSVTSLAQGTQHAGIPLARSGVGTGGMSGAAYVRRRHTPSPANPVLVARRRLLDKALLHRARVRDSGPQSGQQVTSVRRDLSCYAASDGRKVGLPQTASYDLTTPRPLNMRGLHQGVSPHRRWIHQRVGVPVRSPQNTPRVGVRLPDPSASGSASQNVVPTTRPQNVTSQPSPPPPPPPQRSNVDPAALSSLQEQIQALGSEVRNLGLALRMMVEQQGRLEREQAQQTQVQKQILSTLQELAPRLEPCSVMHSSSTPTMSASCSLASSASFSQSAANQGTFAQCSQAQTRYNEIHDSGLESIEPFSLDQLSPPTINGFQQCPTSEGPLFTHTQARTPVFTQAHPQTFSSNTLSYAPSDSFTAIDAKSVDMPINSANGTFQTRTPPSQSSRDPVSPCEPELNIIKVESV